MQGTLHCQEANRGVRSTNAQAMRALSRDMSSTGRARPPGNGTMPATWSTRRQVRAAEASALRVEEGPRRCMERMSHPIPSIGWTRFMIGCDACVAPAWRAVGTRVDLLVTRPFVKGRKDEIGVEMSDEQAPAPVSLKDKDPPLT